MLNLLYNVYTTSYQMRLLLAKIEYFLQPSLAQSHIINNFLQLFIISS